ncbi:MAG: AzlD domain-containing protein [Ktedonobacteraceae bacterium]|nr:AzlD domain-containing protein [Ktedonobacteraceae bacterium]
MAQGILWIVVIVSGLLTFAIRLSFILLLDKIKISTVIEQALRFVPLTVLAAIIAPALFLPRGTLDISLSNARLIAGILAILIAWRTKNVFLTIIVGMVCLLLLQFLL